MVGDVVGMGLIAVLFALVVASLAILPHDGGTAPRRPPLALRRRRLPSLRVARAKLSQATLRGRS